MKSIFWTSLSVLYALCAYYEFAWAYYPISVILFLFAIIGTFALFTVNSIQFAQQAIDRELGWSLYLNCAINTGVLIYLGWYIAALVYGTMILMGLTKRLAGLYMLKVNNT